MKRTPYSARTIIFCRQVTLTLSSVVKEDCRHMRMYKSKIPLKSTSIQSAEPHSSVSCVADLRTGGRWFGPGLGQYSFQGFMIVIATGFFPLSPLSVLSAMVMWESSQGLGKNIVRSTGYKSSRKAWTGALPAAMLLKYCLKWR